MKYIVEHMEESLSEWVEIEYKNMIRNVGENNLILSSLSLNLIENIGLKLNGSILTTESVSDWTPERQSRILLLDPSATQELSIDDSESFDYLLFGGILGDDPPQDRTGILRRMGFKTRHLGPIQMTTDTAVLVARQITEFKRALGSIPFVDHPTIMLGKKESVMLPFRFLTLSDGLPILAPGLKEHLKEQNDLSLF